ncbi:MAG: hypothetical protein ACLR71_16950 [[Clostridium] scindens]
MIHTTFLNRSWSSREINELRQISNQASIAWKDSQLDENGDPLETGAHMGSKDSQIVYAQIPSYIEKIPEVRITNTIQNQKASGFFSGEDIKYQVMAENVDVENQEEVFKEPVISVRMPADTTLVQSTSQPIQRIQRILSEPGRPADHDSVYKASISWQAMCILMSQLMQMGITWKMRAGRRSSIRLYSRTSNWAKESRYSLTLPERSLTRRRQT